MTALVRIRNLSKTYRRGPEQVHVLHGIDLDIAEGDFVALMGPSGSGKTTLLNLIGGLDSPTAGEIAVAGQRIDAMSGGQLAQWRSDHVGFVFQFYNLMPTLTAQKNVELPLLLTKLSSAQRKRNAEVALDIIKYFTSAEVQKELALINKTIPAATAALEDPEVAALPAVSGFGNAIKNGVPMSPSPYSGAQWVPVGRAAVSIYNGSAEPQAAMDEAQAAVEQAVADMQ